MEKQKLILNDKTVEKIMGMLLRYGVISAAVLVGVGAIVFLIQHGSDQTHYQEFVGEPKRFTEFGAIIVAAFQGSGRSIIQLGVLLLIATPISRIVFAVLGYLLERDYLYMIISLIVLAILLANL